MSDWRERLEEETKELAERLNKLQDFMRTDAFYILDRKRKDLMYDQLHAMLTYLQVLGKRCELEGIVITMWDGEDESEVYHRELDKEVDNAWRYYQILYPQVRPQDVEGLLEENKG